MNSAQENLHSKTKTGDWRKAQAQAEAEGQCERNANLGTETGDWRKTPTESEHIARLMEEMELRLQELERLLSVEQKLMETPAQCTGTQMARHPHALKDIEVKEMEQQMHNLEKGWWEWKVQGKEQRIQQLKAELNAAELREKHMAKVIQKKDKELRELKRKLNKTEVQEKEKRLQYMIKPNSSCSRCLSLAKDSKGTLLDKVKK